MTSAVSEEDVRFAAYSAGIKNAARLNAFMKIVNLYAYALARKINGTEEAPPPPVKLHLCRGCGDMKLIEEFPESKRANAARGVNCTQCQGKREYKCTGPCGQLKPLHEFPERKQANPHLPSFCTYCSSKTITRQDAGYSDDVRNLRDSETIPDPAAAGAADRPGVAS